VTISPILFVIPEGNLRLARTTTTMSGGTE